MRIYLTGSCSKTYRPSMEQAAKILRGRGFEVYCPWEMKIPQAWNMTQEDWANRVFAVDLEMMKNADYIVVIAPGRFSAASAWEQGYAYASGKQVVVFQLNEQEVNIMTYCGCHNFVPTKSSYWNLQNYPFDGQLYRKEPCETKLF